jgi:hypothetical protein
LTTWAGLTVLTNISPIKMLRDTNVSEVYHYYTFPHISSNWFIYFSQIFYLL